MRASGANALEQIEALVRSDAATGRPGRGLAVTMTNLPARGLIAWQILNGSGDPWFLVDRLRAYAALSFSFLEPRKVVGAFGVGTKTFSAIASDRVDRIQKLANIGALPMTEGCRSWHKETRKQPAGSFAEWLANRAQGNAMTIDVGAPFDALVTGWPSLPSLEGICDYHLTCETPEFRACTRPTRSS